MANDAAGVSWDVNAPAITDDRRDGAEEIRGLRKGVENRLNKEHIDMSGTAAPADGGEHIKGSAIAYLETGEPAARPDGVTALTSQDDGRLLVDDTAGYILKVYEDPSWVAVTGVQIAVGNFTGAALFAGQQAPDALFAVDLFILLVPVSADHYSYVVPLKENAGPFAGLSESTGSNQIKLTFERVGTTVEIDWDSGQTPTGTCRWMAFDFG